MDNPEKQQHSRDEQTRSVHPNRERSRGNGPRTKMPGSKTPRSKHPRPEHPRREVNQAQFQSVAGGENPHSIWPHKLPPASPVWFPSVMGTAMLSSLLGRLTPEHSWLVYPATALVCIAITLFIGLSIGFAVNASRNPGLFTRTWQDMSILPTWGTVSMGLTATGSAIHTVGPLLPFGTTDAHRGGLTADAPATWVIVAAALSWVVGTCIGLYTTFRVGLLLMERHMNNPVPAWGLAVVPPMVSSTTGANLAADVKATLPTVMLVMAANACFFLALFFGFLLFTLAYRSHFYYHPLPIDASISAWIPLGVVGQSAAAAQAIAAQAEIMMKPSAIPSITWLAHAYGWFVLAAAIPVVGFAVVRTIHGFISRMTFTPGWWALTFPIGTLALGMSTMVDAMSGPWRLIPRVVGTGSLIVLCCTWTFCAAATITAILKTRPQAVAVAS